MEKLLLVKDVVTDALFRRKPLAARAALLLSIMAMGALHAQALAPGAAPVPILSLANQLFHAQNLPDAIQALDDYTRTNPKAADVPAALLLKGQCEAHSKGSTQAQAEKTWGWLIQNYPHSDEAVRAYQELSAYYASQSRPDLAEKTKQETIATEVPRGLQWASRQAS